MKEYKLNHGQMSDAANKTSSNDAGNHSGPCLTTYLSFMLRFPFSVRANIHDGYGLPTRVALPSRSMVKFVSDDGLHGVEA